eukprot:TRINITY_DN7336_c0_g1_i4.p3 TRINITY_DN7336_c0_g1~~TRINITY_DN7336_c0_g1_i4.p3  ORF type:complete len:114 (-),score=9.34 TRINITY_DN7336_c0_g1_i4:438-779(-)
MKDVKVEESAEDSNQLPIKSTAEDVTKRMKMVRPKPIEQHTKPVISHDVNCIIQIDNTRPRPVLRCILKEGDAKEQPCNSSIQAAAKSLKETPATKSFHRRIQPGCVHHSSRN